MTQETEQMPFDKGNYVRLCIAIAVIFLGFFLMNLEKATYGQGVLGMTLGPCMVLSGFVTGFFAIFHRARSETPNK